MLEYKGRRPRFNPAHIASKGVRFAAVADGANFRSLLSGKLGTIHGTTATIDPRLGPAALISASGSNANNYIGFVSPGQTSPASSTIAAIFTYQTNGNFSGLFGAAAENFGNWLGISTGDNILHFYNGTDLASGLALTPGRTYMAVGCASAAAGNFGFVDFATGRIQTSSVAGAAVSNANDQTWCIGNNFNLSTNSLAGSETAVYYAANFLTLPQIVQWLQAEFQDQFGVGPGSFWYERRQLNRAMLFSQPASGGSPTGNLTSAAGIGVAGSLTSSVATAGLTQASGTGTANAVVANPAALITGAVGTGVAGLLTTTESSNVTLPPATGIGVARALVPTVTITLAQAAGIGTAGSLAGADSTTLAPATGTGVAGQLSASVSVAFSGAIGTGVAGSIGSLDIPGLVGVAGTGVAQGITPQVSAFLSGATGTGQAGTFSFAGAGTGNLTGVAGTGVAGSITASIQGFFAGAFGTGVAHTFTAEVDKTLTGVAGIGVAGTLTTTASGSGTLVGASGTGVAGNLNGQDGKGITGASGTGVAHVGNAEVDHGLTGGVGTGVAGQISSTATGNVSIGLTGVAGIGVAGIITANVPAPPVATGGGNGGSLPAPKRRKTIPRPIEAPKPKVEAVLLPPSTARPTPVVARSLPPEPSLTHPLMGALAPPRTTIVKPDDAEDEHAIAMLLEQQIAAERPIREAISQMLIDIMKSIETEIA